MKSKNLPATGRLIRLLEHLAGYSFNFYYVKGKDMIPCDYLSRIAVDNGDPEEVIPIFFNALAQYRLAIVISGGFGYLIGWFVGGTGCTLQTLYAWLMRGFGIGKVGILIYRVLRLSLRCDSWYECYVINLVK